MPRLSAIVVTHRADGLVAACLASLAAQTRPPDEIVVVVSAAGRTLPNEDVPALPDGAKVVVLTDNPGYARACHEGAARTTGELLLLNDDTVLHDGCLATLEAAWVGEGHVYQPRIRLAQDPSRLDNVGHGLFLDGACWALGRNGPDQPPQGVPGAFSGAAALIPRAAWSATGGFDARFGAWAEDLDLSLRLLRRGITVLPVPDAVVDHHLGASYGRTGAGKLRQLERNRVRAALRSLPAPLVATLPAWTLARYALFAALAAAGRGPGDKVPDGARRAAVLGALDALRETPVWLEARAQDRAAWALDEPAMLRAMWRRRARWEDLCRPAP